ncbi:MAG TPA: SulP family inorganic anion transporter [Cyclobacteriaceae bacterium]|nr:SulP family inorganic anion transporter [Cyclobacteriaceae bacterium]
MKTLEIPKDGLEGLKQNWTADALSGFLVFLLAMPLSLGIAKASGFSAAMGVLTAMVGGLVVSVFMGGRLTIKGPAAGLITVCAGAVTDLGKLNIEGVSGVQLACAAVIVMSVIQAGFGFMKFGSFSDFFPRSAVHGMLAAIGVLIFAKQFPVLLGVEASFTKGLSPIELYTHIPTFIENAHPEIATIGLLSLVILFGVPAMGGIFKKIPAPLIVLVVTIPFGIYFNFNTILDGSGKPFALVSIVDFWKDVKFTASFAAIGNGTFWYYVFMFLFVNSLESLLTVKAIDGLDPWKRKSDYNTDLKALALGNGVSGALGGLPMISEVARSSANVNFGGRTRWANFFHGLFLLIAMLVLIPVINKIPNAALAAMLIAVAYRLASPKEFIGTYKIGPEQLVIFLTTIFVTVSEDLLLGVASGILVKFVFHIFNGAPLSSLFKANYEVKETSDGYSIKILQSAIFSNLLGYQKMWNNLPLGKKITFNFAETKLVDHTFQEALHHFDEDYHNSGGQITISGFSKHKALSAHPLASRKLTRGPAHSMVIELSARAEALQAFAEAYGFNFYPQQVKVGLKYKNFPIQKGSTLRYEENLMEKYSENAKVEVSDITVTEILFASTEDTHITVIHLSDTDLQIPDFALEPESLHTKLSEVSGSKDIDFNEHPDFSKMYYLRGEDEDAVRNFFDGPVIQFLESHDEMHIECHKNRLLIFKQRGLMTPEEIEASVKFSEAFVEVASKRLVV